MTLGNRRRILYLLIAAFFIIGAFVLLYVNGWRVDIIGLKIEKVGAIFVRSFPQEASIYLDNKLIDNNSGFFEKGTLINGLFPKNYKLKLKLDNYQPWEESVSVSPSLVTEAYAVLVPQKPTTVSTGTLKNFWVIDDKVIVQNNSNNLSIGGEKIGNGEVVGWTKNGEAALLKNPATNSYSLFDLQKDEGQGIGDVLQKNGLTGSVLNIKLNPEDKNELIVSGAKKIFAIDAGKSTLTNIYQTKMGIGVETAPSEFLTAWTKFNIGNNTSTIVIFDKFLKKVLYESPGFSGKSLELTWANNKKIISLQDDGKLYVYDSENETLKMAASNVKSFELSSDSSKLAVIENNSLEILSLDNDRGYYRFNLPEMQSVLDATWYKDNGHLFVFYPERVAFLDLNDASLSNLLTIVKNYKRAFYDEKNNYFYVLKESDIEKFDFPR